MASDRFQPVRVLIADDDHRVRTALRALLCAGEGLDVVADASSAATALRLAREHAPTVVIVDVLLPEANDGLSLLRAITDELHLPAVAISMDSEMQSCALAAGACDFVGKDGLSERLFTAVRDATRVDRGPAHRRRGQWWPGAAKNDPLAVGAGSLHGMVL